MIEYQNLFKIKSEIGLLEEEFSAEDKNLKIFLENIKKQNLGFYELPYKIDEVKKIKTLAEKLKGKYNDIVILGIGGSALGAICLKKALGNSISGTKPQLHIIDNIDPVFIADLEKNISLEKTLFLVITKSGSTPETLAQYFYFSDKLKKQNLKKKNHFIFITDPEEGLLREFATREEIISFEVPKNVGGRFSVLSAVGLLPAALVGFDIESLIEGAKEMTEIFLSENPEENECFKLAKIQYELRKKGSTINVIMPYSQKLSNLSSWYSQLLAESIGKKHDRNGKVINIGITPQVALGVTDQHSQSQLYNEGPYDKLIIFISVKNLGIEIDIPTNEVPYLNNITFNKLLETEKQGTELAFNENNRPNITITLDHVDEKNLGSIFMLFEGSIAFLGEMFNINAFDQPGVELSKQLTKKLLS